MKNKILLSLLIISFCSFKGLDSNCDISFAQTVVANNIILSTKSFTSLNIDPTLTTVSNTQIVSSKAIKDYVFHQDSVVTANIMSYISGIIPATIVPGAGITMVGSGSSTTISVDNTIMTVIRATDSINALNSRIPLNNNQLSNGSGYITASSTNTLTNKSGNISQWTDDVGYLTGITSSQINSALGYMPYSAANPNGYMSSVPAQSFASLTGKPTTLSGYGITDAYPLSGNPSAFITASALSPYALSISLSGYVPTSTTYTVNGYGGALSTNRSITLSTADILESGNQYFTNARSRSSVSITTTGSGVASYNSSTGVLNVPTAVTYVPSVNSATRPTDSTTFTVSSTLQATVIYNIQITCTASIGSASTGQALLRYSTNGGTTWINAGVVKNSNTVTLALTLNAVTIQTSAIMAIIPANALCKLVTTTTGTTSVTYVSGQEIY